MGQSVPGVELKFSGRRTSSEPERYARFDRFLEPTRSMPELETTPEKLLRVAADRLTGGVSF
jgi:hypothetical protein